MMAPPKKSSVMFALLAVFLCYCCGSSHNFVVAVDNNDDSNSKAATKARTNFLRRSMTDNQVDVVVVNDAVAKDRRELMPSNNKCGCSTCTQEVLNVDAGGYSCGARIDWMVSSMEYSEEDACNLVAGEEFPSGMYLYLYG